MNSSQSSARLPLFRPEALSASDKHALGAIRLAQPLSAWLIVGCALAISAALIAFVTFGSVTRKSRVAGITVPRMGSLGIAAPNAGVLVRHHVREGQIVTAGQPLFELSTERQGASGELTALVAQQLATRQATLESELRLRTTQYRDKKRSVQDRLQNLAMEAVQLEQEIVLAQRRHELVLQSLGKFETLQQNLMSFLLMEENLYHLKMRSGKSQNIKGGRMKFSITNYPMFGIVIMISFSCIPWFFNMAGFISPLKDTGKNVFPGLLLFVISGIGMTFIIGLALNFLLSFFISNKE